MLIYDYDTSPAELHPAWYPPVTVVLDSQPCLHLWHGTLAITWLLHQKEGFVAHSQGLTLQVAHSRGTHVFALFCKTIKPPEARRVCILPVLLQIGACAQIVNSL